MRVHCLLNRDGGGLKTTDIETLSQKIAASFEARGHDISMSVVHGHEMEQALDDAVKGNFDVLLAAGGDGTLSSVAGKLAGTSTALGILPGGTMNLFARSLNIPFDLEAAAEALAQGHIDTIDTARMNDRVFLLHFSIGLHAHLVKKRKTMTHNSRLQKMYASFHAAIVTFTKPPELKLELDLDGRVLHCSTPAVSVSNNIYGEGHLPYADRLDEGILGIYLCTARNSIELFKLGLNILLGRWQSGGGIQVLRAKHVKLALSGQHPRQKIILDGEMLDMPDSIDISIQPKSLKILRPAL